MTDQLRVWSPSAALVGVCWVGAVLAVGWFVAMVRSGADPPGTLLSGLAAAGLFLAALYGTRARPRLRADPDGITVAGLLRHRHIPWPLVGPVHVVTVRRLGRPSPLLEIDTTTAAGAEQLLVFGRLDLGADPRDVAGQVQAMRPTTRPR